ncbi:MAG TPA: endonuclease/exonuclease/phosphatase family protein [Candidatus Dormibacteraeota bacterium]|nr:endonuclease/exonuclease/phosphatase family protein [Candidatus Dormibacteraeota bacterium]
MGPRPSASPPRLKLCTWNLHLGLELPAILRSIGAEEDFRTLDLLALQEASVHDSREDAEAIATALGPDFRHHQVETHLLNGRVQANALVWNSRRARILDQSVLLLPKRAEHTMSRTERALLSVTRLQQRMALFFDCWIAGQAIRVYVAHLDVFGYEHKLHQFERILADLENREPADITILAGDLNTFKMGTRPRWTRLRSAAALAGFEDLTTDIKWTHRHRMPARQKLDAIFVRSERSLLYESWSLDLPGSDHIPVFAEVLGWGD